MVTTIHSAARLQWKARNAITERMAAAVSPSPPRNETKIIALVTGGEA